MKKAPVGFFEKQGMTGSEGLDEMFEKRSDHGRKGLYYSRVMFEAVVPYWEAEDGQLRKLKLLPDEAEIIYKIFDLYEQYDSLTMTETELLRQGVKTKTGRSFTRFSIKSILQNPVYLIADKDAYQYFVDNEAELFAPESDFDGIPAQSQEKGQAILHKLK